MPKEIDIEFGHDITQRFLFAIDRIVGNQATGKITQEKVGAILGISSSNINRLRNNPDRRITIESCGRLCHHFKISAFWLITGQGDLYSNDEILASYKTLETRFSDLEKAVMDMQKALSFIRKANKKWVNIRHKK